jgi:hypothetical protein
MNLDSIHQLRLEFEKMFSRIPNFISSIDNLHVVLWHALLECNDVLMRLVVARVLSDRQISKIINDFHDYIEAIIDNTPGALHLHISAYYTILLKKMIMRSKEEEHYEVSANVKKFSDFYFNNNITTP